MTSSCFDFQVPQKNSKWKCTSGSKPEPAPKCSACTSLRAHVRCRSQRQHQIHETFTAVWCPGQQTKRKWGEHPGILHQLLHGSDFKPEIAMLLYAAGEDIDTHHVDTPDCIKDTDNAFNLKFLCINSIRNHLLNLEVHGNLFSRVPYLPLPTMLKNNLLFDVLVSRDSGEYGQETAV